MKITTQMPCIVLAAASLAISAAAQTQFPGTPIPPEQAQGLFSNLAVGLTVTDGADSALWIRAPGANSGIPLEWNATTFGVATPTHPNYSETALTHWAIPGREPTFGGISTGGDIMPSVDSLGRMQMQPNLWCMVSVVLDSQAQGEPGSLLNSRVLQGKNPATEIMSYYVQGSTGINPRLVDTVRMEYTGTQLNLQQAQPQPPGNREIVNHDFAMGVHSTNLSGSPDPMFPIRDRFYFTLTADYASWLSNQGQTLGGDTPCASNIYMMFWDGSLLQWTQPTIAFSHTRLFPGHDVGEVEIDALSVFEHPPTNQSRVVISLTPASDSWPNEVFDQLLVYQETSGVTTCQTTTLRTPLGMAITQKQGLKVRTGAGSTPSTGTPDNVKSACIGDPFDLMALSRRMGIATDELRQGDGRLGFTAVRRSPPASAMDEIHVQVTGLDLAGYMFGFVWLQLEGPPVSAPTPYQQPIPLGNAYLLDPVSLQRNAFDLVIPTPSTVGPSPLRFSVQLWGANPGNPPTASMLRESWVLTVYM